MKTDPELTRLNSELHDLINKIIDQYAPPGSPDRITLLDDLYRLIEIERNHSFRVHEINAGYR